MRTLAIAIALLLMAPAAAMAKVTPDIAFKSTGKAMQPGVVVGAGEEGTFEDIPFSIPAGDSDGTVKIEIHWGDGTDDFDLTVYRKNTTGGLDAVGSSAGGPPGQSEATSIAGQNGPVEPGDFVIRVQNYASKTPDFEGSVTFKEFVPANAKPTAALKAPKTAKSNKAVKLDASGSKDSDGTIANYAWDLDGDGSMETDGGKTATLSRKFGVGVHHVTVRVIDDRGGRAYASRTVRVTKPAAKKKKKK